MFESIRIKISNWLKPHPHKLLISSNWIKEDTNIYYLPFHNHRIYFFLESNRVFRSDTNGKVLIPSGEMSNQRFFKLTNVRTLLQNYKFGDALPTLGSKNYPKKETIRFFIEEKRKEIHSEKQFEILNEIELKLERDGDGRNLTFFELNFLEKVG